MLWPQPSQPGVRNHFRAHHPPSKGMQTCRGVITIRQLKPKCEASTFVGMPTVRAMSSCRASMLSTPRTDLAQTNAARTSSTSRSTTRPTYWEHQHTHRGQAMCTRCASRKKSLVPMPRPNENVHGEVVCRWRQSHAKTDHASFEANLAIVQRPPRSSIIAGPTIMHEPFARVTISVHNP